MALSYAFLARIDLFWRTINVVHAKEAYLSAIRDRSTVRAGLSRQHASQGQQALMDYCLYLFTHFVWRCIQ